MKICIIGWYGSETLGDRSILIGLSQVFNKTYGECTIFLGSLNPEFSERCLIEDRTFYDSVSPDVNIVIFNSKDKKQLEKHILQSNLIGMGGGPIMDLGSLILIHYSFMFAKKNKIKTALLGCGLGPLMKEKFKKMAVDILLCSDLVIFRDEKSIETAKKLLSEYRQSYNSKMYYLHDPAIIPIGYFITIADKKENTEYLLINLRDFPAKTFCAEKNVNLDHNFSKMICNLSQSYEEIILVPMHTYFHGHDDRLYLSKIKQITNCENIKVIQRPQSVLDLFYTIKNASACIGMRYHSIVFQTFISGKNAIIDYTFPYNGKIISFIELINGNKHYASLYINLHTENINFDKFSSNLSELKKLGKFQYATNIFDDTMNGYSRLLVKFKC